MDAVEMLKEVNRMTKKCQIDCRSCEFKERCVDIRIDDPEKYVEIVENWSKAHPRPTLADLFFERYPDAKKDENGVPFFCPRKVFAKVHDRECLSLRCDDCRKKHWLAPVEEKE